MRVLCAPDKFGGAASARQIAEAMAAGVRRAGADPILLPIADGGEGTFDVLRHRFVVAEHITVPDPLDRRARARIGWFDRQTVFVEAADACGFRRGAPADLDPMDTNTAGVGILTRNALERVPQVIVGLGGSATFDLGAGLAWSLGDRFLAADGRRLGPAVPALADVQTVELPDLSAWHGRVTAWCDVAVPLLDAPVSGTSFLAQKGVRDPALVERVWRRLVACLPGAEPGRPGAGAAGGLGCMLHALFGASLVPGADAVLDAVGFDDALAEADVVLTGEGRFDAQSLTGKGPWRVVQRSGGRPVAVLAGAVAPGVDPPGATVIAISDPSAPPTEQIAGTLSNVAAASERFVRDL